MTEISAVPAYNPMEEWAKDLGCLSILSAGVEMAEGDAAGFAPIAVITRKVL